MFDIIPGKMKIVLCPIKRQIYFRNVFHLALCNL